MQTQTNTSSANAVMQQIDRVLHMRCQSESEYEVFASLLQEMEEYEQEALLDFFGDESDRIQKDFNATEDHSFDRALKNHQKFNKKLWNFLKDLLGEKQQLKEQLPLLRALLLKPAEGIERYAQTIESTETTSQPVNWDTVDVTNLSPIVLHSLTDSIRKNGLGEYVSEEQQQEIVRVLREIEELSAQYHLCNYFLSEISSSES